MTDLNKLLGLDADVPQIKLRPLDHLVAYARNSRTHSPAQVEQLQALLLEFGWTNAVLVDADGIVAGHGRCLAAEAIYQRGEQIKFPNGSPIPIGMVPTLDCTGWTEAQRKAYIIADNRSALSAGWDEDMLRVELKELEAMEYDLSLTAFSDDELADLLARRRRGGAGGLRWPRHSAAAVRLHRRQQAKRESLVAREGPAGGGPALPPHSARRVRPGGGLTRHGIRCSDLDRPVITSIVRHWTQFRARIGRDDNEG